MSSFSSSASLAEQLVSYEAIVLDMKVKVSEREPQHAHAQLKPRNSERTKYVHILSTREAS